MSSAFFSWAAKGRGPGMATTAAIAPRQPDSENQVRDMELLRGFHPMGVAVNDRTRGEKSSQPVDSRSKSLTYDFNAPSHGVPGRLSSGKTAIRTLSGRFRSIVPFFGFTERLWK